MAWQSPPELDEAKLSPRDQLAENVLSLFNSSEYSDLTITSRNKTFKVHKALVCSRSEYFQKACKQGVWKEGQNAAIDLQKDEDMPVQMDDPTLLEYMLHYLYGLDYMEEEKPKESTWASKRGSKKHLKKRMPVEWFEDEQTPHEEEPIPSNFESDGSKGISLGGNAAVHAQMCAVADFYGIPDLQEVARRKFRIALDKIYDSPGIVEVFKLVCNPDFRSDEVLRECMVDKIATDTNLLDVPDIAEILQEDGQLALAIMKCMRLK
ncbi:MAG: hypothetical protein Q9191_006917 [Dirinaria sp. TL-2023a]